MKGMLPIFVLLLIPTAVFAQDFNQRQIREMYFNGWDGECGAVELNDLLMPHPFSSNAILLAYKGAAQTTLANCKKTPFSKLSAFNKGKEYLEDAVNRDPKNVEIRFIRYTIQTNIPDFLYYNNIEEDRKFIWESIILQPIPPVDADLKERILNYFLLDEGLTESEMKKIEQITNGG